MSVIHDDPGTITSGFRAGLPTRPWTGERLKRRTKDSPPPPWDTEALAAYFGRMPKYVAGEHRDSRPPVPRSQSMRARILAMAVGEKMLIEGAGDWYQLYSVREACRIVRSRISASFEVQEERATGVWVTRTG